MNSGWYIIPFLLSIFVFFAAMGAAIYWFAKPKVLKNKNVFVVTKNTGRHLMWILLILLVSVWLLRFAIGNWCFEHPDDLGVIPQMSVWRQVFNSFLHGLQTFSMDEDYTAYLENGIKMATAVFGDFEWIHVLYLPISNVIAPIAGGAFVFEILVGIFPQLRYIVSQLEWYKTRFYFTALNEQSLALAKSIASEPSFKHVLLIFTDVYSDDEDEDSSELLLSAKALGAICLKDDLLHISLWKIRNNRTYIFLSDSEETENLQTLAQLLNPEKQKELEETEIRVFGTDKRMSNIEDEVIYLHNRLSSEFEKKGKKIIPDVAPVNGVRKMSQRLFYELPLFEGLYGKDQKNKELNLTIIGSGAIGTEMFLNAYWFGQMIGVELNINVISANETEQEFVSRINGINPDIMATSKEGDEVLNAKIGEDGTAKTLIGQPRYFHFRYDQKNIVNCNLESYLKTGLGDDGFCLRDTDYFIIAAGSDEENFLIADRLRREIGYYHLNEDRQGKTVISYVIYNSDLCRALNAEARHNHISDAEVGEFDIYMHAFGCMDEIYSVSNILRREFKRQIRGVRETYRQQANAKDSIFEDIKGRKYYNTRADEARVLHFRYKVYSSGILKPSLFNTENDSRYNQLIRDAEDLFIDNVKTKWMYPEYSSQANALAWMEKRRWNAFMRINGFKKPADIDKYIELNSSIHSLKTNHDKAYQFLFIKLHPCIVECDIKGYPGIYSKENDKRNPGVVDIGPDELDLLCKRLGIDYKAYDYPEADAQKQKTG